MTGPDRAEGTAVLSDEERERMVGVMSPAMGDECTRDELRAYAVRLHAAGYARAALPGTADTGAREAVERVRAVLAEHWDWKAGRSLHAAVARALAATPDGHQHAAEES